MGLWKALWKWGHLINIKMSFVVGDEWRIKFWRDRWCGDTPLCVDFWSLFALVRAKDARVGDVWSMEQGRGSWNPTFIRLFNAWEMEEVESFLFRLRDKKVTEGLDDTIRWEGSRNVVVK